MGESRFSDDTDFSDFMNAVVAQLVERGPEKTRVTGSIPVVGTICHCSSVGRASV